MGTELDIMRSRLDNIDSSQTNLEQNLNPDEALAQVQLGFTDEVSLSGTVQIIRRNLASTSFVLDHPVYGILNSSTLYLNGGYATSLIGFSMPITMPITFSGTTATSLLYSTNF